MSGPPETDALERGLCLFGLLVFVAGRCLVPMDETDLFFNLRLGEVVLAEHRVPTRNLLSFTYPEARDVNLAWVFQILLALVHRVGGIAGTVVLKTLFVLGTAAVLFRVALRRGAHPAGAAFALALAAWAAEPRFVERPHLVTFLGLALLLLALERGEAGPSPGLSPLAGRGDGPDLPPRTGRGDGPDPAPRTGRGDGPDLPPRTGRGDGPDLPPRTERGARRLVLPPGVLVPGALVWANANSCFFLAPIVLLLYAVGSHLDGRRPEARRAAMSALVLSPFVFATPSGVHALEYLANHWRMPSLRPLQEYRTVEWPLDGPFVFVAAGALLSAALPGRRWRHLLPAAALGLIGAVRIRFAAEHALLAGPILACLPGQLAAALRRPRDTAAVSGLRASRLLSGAATAALLALALIPRLGAFRAGEPFLSLGLEPGLVPLAALRFADENRLRERMYNDLEVGSYLTWDGWPRHRVFQDPRINGYPAEMHAFLRRDDLTRTEWEAYLDRFGVRTALVSYPSLNPRSALFDPNRWALVYRDGDALLFVRREKSFARLVARAEIPLGFRYARAQGVTLHALHVPPANPAVPACEWRRRLGDVLVELGDDRAAFDAYRAASAPPICLDEAGQRAALLALGDVALRLGEPATAASAYQGIDLPRARRNRGLALLALGRHQEALAELRAALASDPADAAAQLGEKLARERLSREGR